MPFEWMLLAVVATTAVTVFLVMAGFWAGLVRPYLDKKVDEIIEAAKEVEPGVKRGIREGVEETLRELPETTMKESTHQFRRFGTGLFENGLSSLLGEQSNTSRKKPDD